MSEQIFPGVYSESQSSSFIAVQRKEGIVRCVILRKLSSQTYYDVDERPVEDFGTKYQLLPNFPPAKAAKVYVQFGKYFGASPEALQLLSSLVGITSEDMDMSRKSKDKMTEQSGEQVPVSEDTGKGIREVKVREPRAPRQSAARLFMDLIMEGILTDDEIFAAVKEKFGLDDKKRSYVAWYRNHLRKKLGLNPPPPVVRPTAQPEQQVQ